MHVWGERKKVVENCDSRSGIRLQTVRDGKRDSILSRKFWDRDLPKLFVVMTWSRLIMPLLQLRQQARTVGIGAATGVGFVGTDFSQTKTWSLQNSATVGSDWMRTKLAPRGEYGDHQGVTSPGSVSWQDWCFRQRWSLRALCGVQRKGRMCAVWG
jgi:hypothetical protein